MEVRNISLNSCIWPTFYYALRNMTVVSSQLSVVMAFQPLIIPSTFFNDINYDFHIIHFQKP